MNLRHLYQIISSNRPHRGLRGSSQKAHSAIRLAALLSILAFPVVSSAQLNLAWSQRIETRIEATSLLETASVSYQDGAYVVGIPFAFGTRLDDKYVVTAYNPDGRVRWSRSLTIGHAGPIAELYGKKLLIHAGGDLLICARFRRYGGQIDSIARLSASDGSTKWQYHDPLLDFGSQSGDYPFWNIVPTQEGDYIVSRHSYHQPRPSLIKLNGQTGRPMWTVIAPQERSGYREVFHDTALIGGTIYCGSRLRPDALVRYDAQSGQPLNPLALPSPIAGRGGVYKIAKAESDFIILQVGGGFQPVSVSRLKVNGELVWTTTLVSINDPEYRTSLHPYGDDLYVNIGSTKYRLNVHTGRTEWSVLGHEYKHLVVSHNGRLFNLIENLPLTFVVQELSRSSGEVLWSKAFSQADGVIMLDLGSRPMLISTYSDRTDAGVFLGNSYPPTTFALKPFSAEAEVHDSGTIVHPMPNGDVVILSRSLNHYRVQRIRPDGSWAWETVQSRSLDAGTSVTYGADLRYSAIAIDPDYHWMVLRNSGPKSGISIVNLGTGAAEHVRLPGGFPTSGSLRLSSQGNLLGMYSFTSDGRTRFNVAAYNIHSRRLIWSRDHVENPTGIGPWNMEMDADGSMIVMGQVDQGSIVGRIDLSGTLVMAAPIGDPLQYVGRLHSGSLVSAYVFGDELILSTHDARTGATLRSLRLPSTRLVVPRPAINASDRAFFLVLQEGTRVAVMAIDMESMQIAWTAKPTGRTGKDWFRSILIERSGALTVAASQGGNLVGSPWQLWRLDPQTGATIWSHADMETGFSTPPRILEDGSLITTRSVRDDRSSDMIVERWIP